MKSYKRVASAVLGMAMAASCMAPITAFAAEDFQQPTDNTVIANHPNDETMLHSTPVYRIGTKSFYKVNDDGSVTYADQDTAGFKAVPAAYIMGSSYNTVGEYGIYTTTKSDGSKLEHFVKISDCQEANGKVNWNHGTADEAKVSDDTKANGVDTASNEDPTMSTQFYIYLDNNSEIPEETPPTEEEHPGVATDDGRVEYDITVATVNHVNVKATVPLYVCMYGFRSTGNVVTPTKDAYQLRNYSTIDKNSRTYIPDKKPEQLETPAWPDGMNGPKFTESVVAYGSLPRKVGAEEANVFLFARYNTDKDMGSYGLCIDMGKDFVQSSKCGKANNPEEYALMGAIEMLLALDEHTVRDVVIYTEPVVAKIMNENANRLLDGKSPVRRKYIELAWKAMTKVSVRFVTTKVNSEYGKLALLPQNTWRSVSADKNIEE